MSIYVTVQGDDIIGFSLRDNERLTTRNGVLITFSSIEITPYDFDIFKNALKKALEWESIASQNDVSEFSKTIPFEISSNNVSWTTYSGFVDHLIKKGETLTLEFTFSWSPERSRGALYINSNIVNSSVSGSKVSFSFSKEYMYRDEIELLLENITDEKIQEAIKNGRIQQIEEEARKKRTETLFN
jgi:hypothetical protein